MNLYKEIWATQLTTENISEVYNYIQDLKPLGFIHLNNDTIYINSPLQTTQAKISDYLVVEVINNELLLVKYSEDEFNNLEYLIPTEDDNNDTNDLIDEENI